MAQNVQRIGMLRESSLHESLKNHYAQLYRGEMESLVDGYIVDVFTEDGRIIEIQTGNFSNIKGKLLRLLNDHRVTLVYPIALRKDILLFDAEGNLKRRRKSPQKGFPVLAARELIRIPELPLKGNFTFEIVMVKVEEVRIDDGKGSWRRKGVSIAEKRLVSIEDSFTFNVPGDYLSLLPQGLSPEFTNREVAEAGHLRRSQATKLTWFLKKVGVLQVSGKVGNSYLYRCPTDL